MNAPKSRFSGILLAALALAGCAQSPAILPLAPIARAPMASLPRSAAKAPVARVSSGYTVTCDVCHGSGVLHGGPGYYPYTCDHCHGTGRMTTNRPPIGTDH